MSSSSRPVTRRQALRIGGAAIAAGTAALARAAFADESPVAQPRIPAEGYDPSAYASLSQTEGMPTIQDRPAAEERDGGESALKSRTPLSPEQDSSGFVLVSDAVPDAILEIRYFSTFNFVGERISGYEEPVALLTREAADALRLASDAVVGMGLRLKVFDAYRPQTAVDHFVRWSLDPEDTRMKQYFYPELEKDALFPQGYIAEKSGHTRGSTVDLTLFDMATQTNLDMGGTYDYFGLRSHPDFWDVTEVQYANRMLLRQVMLDAGFNPLSTEWWHFSLANEPYPNTYFTFPVATNSV